MSGLNNDGIEIVLRMELKFARRWNFFQVYICLVSIDIYYLHSRYVGTYIGFV